MIITTAKRIAAPLPHLAPLAAAAALMVALPAQAQWNITPSLSLTETYTDNVALSSDANKRAQWVTEARPAITVFGQNSRVQVNARASTSFYKYSDEQVAGTRSNDARLDASGRVKVIDDFLYLEGTARRSSLAVSAFGLRDDTGNRFSDENRTDVNSWSISPVLTRRFGNFAAATLRYTHDSTNADDSRFGDSKSDNLAFDLTSGRAWRDLGWNLRYTQQELDTEQFGGTSSKNALVGLNYALHRTFRLTASGGYDSYDYEASGGRTAGASWSAGFAWNPSARTAVQMAVGRHFLGNTGSLSALHRSRHTVWRASYSDNVTNTRQQFTQTAGIDTIALLDPLFAITYPDAFARRQAILDYLLLAGLPLSTVENVNYLTNRYFRQRQALGSFAFNMRAHSSVVSVAVSERTALSTGEVDSALLGNALFSLNDNVRQISANASHSYRLNAVTTAVASVTATRSRSLTTNFETDQQSLRLAMTRRFSRNLNGSVELRHVRGERGFNSADYKENAISATLSAQL
jgi:uncharacterized protein (PEP-CTERM system associated)